MRLENVGFADATIASFFKTLIDHEVTVELKNDIQLKGVLKSVDQYLNIKLEDIQVVEEMKYPHLVSLSLPILPSQLQTVPVSRHSLPPTARRSCEA